MKFVVFKVNEDESKCPIYESDSLDACLDFVSARPDDERYSIEKHTHLGSEVLS